MRMQILAHRLEHTLQALLQFCCRSLRIASTTRRSLLHVSSYAYVSSILLCVLIFVYLRMRVEGSYACRHPQYEALTCLYTRPSATSVHDLKLLYAGRIYAHAGRCALPMLCLTLRTAICVLILLYISVLLYVSSYSFFFLYFFKLMSKLRPALLHVSFPHISYFYMCIQLEDQLRFDVKLRPARELMMSEVERKLNKTFKAR
jgi:hypothetical protein